MQITGHMLRQKILKLNLKVQVLQRRFDNELFVFPGEIKDPRSVALSILETEKRVVRLQTAQAEYNNIVRIASGETLCEAIKLLGVSGRMTSLFKGILPDKRSRYDRLSEQTRKADDQTSKLVFTNDEIADEVVVYGDWAAELRGGVAVANNTPLDIDWLSQEDLE